MVKSCNELWCDPHFSLKFAVLILGVFVNVFLLYQSTYNTYYEVIVKGYHFSFLTVLLALVIACIWFEATVITEISLLVAALIKLVVITAIYAEHIRGLGWYVADKGVEIPAERPQYQNTHYISKFYLLIPLILIFDTILRTNRCPVRLRFRIVGRQILHFPGHEHSIHDNYFRRHHSTCAEKMRSRKENNVT
ncbi:hypothetical protein TSAR_014130 [Trichomalopsis sarcophagae]|uniref:Uncharacterized protein n=1 Tax=Trichomalopsis sarcophagae TaxID=543379 RepID=A0A232F4K6_9HYME|nr:hypothetical protein TSAR_014130 [Trichomalopsis sarcophagae]